MVSLDEQIQKDRQKHKSQRPNKKPSHTHTKKFNRPDKHRGIRKDDRRPQFSRKDRQQRIGGKRVEREDRVRGGNRQRGAARQRSRISRVPRNEPRVPKSQPRVVPKKQAREVTEQAQQKGRTLKVMGLHPDFTNEDLYKLFSTEGALQKCLIEQDNFGRSLTTAIVKYHNASSAKSAITNLNQHKVMNSILTVEPYKNVPRR